MSNDGQKLMLLELAESLLRSWWTVVAGLCVGLAVSLVILQVTPKVYRASAVIYADADKLPAEFVRPTVEDRLDLQLRALTDAVLREGNVAGLAEEVFGPFASEGEKRQGIERVRAGTRVDLLPRAKSIRVSFEDGNPRRAATVANAVASLFIQENYQFREDRATEITDSVRTLSVAVEEELRLERKARDDYLAKHQNETDARRTYNERKIDQLEEELDQARIALEAAQGQLQILEAQSAQGLTGISGGSEEGGLSAPTVGARALELEAELEELLLRVTENHPDVQSKRRQIEDLRRQAETEAAEAPSDDPAPKVPGLNIWETRIRAAQLEVGRQERKMTSVRSEIERYEVYLAATPAVEQRLREYNSRVQLLEKQYLENQAQIASAKRGQQLEEEKLGNPFVLTDRAGPPSRPVAPDPVKTLGTGLMGGVLIFVGPLLAGFFLRPVIGSEARLRLVTDLPILVTIPVFDSPAARRRRRWMHVRNLGFSGASLAVLAAVVALKYFGMLGP